MGFTWLLSHPLQIISWLCVLFSSPSAMHRRRGRGREGRLPQLLRERWRYQRSSSVNCARNCSRMPWSSLAVATASVMNVSVERLDVSLLPTLCPSHSSSILYSCPITFCLPHFPPSSLLPLFFLLLTSLLPPLFFLIVLFTLLVSSPAFCCPIRYSY